MQLAAQGNIGTVIAWAFFVSLFLGIGWTLGCVVTARILDRFRA